MQFRSRVQRLSTVAFLIGALALWGCAKRPEVFQAGPALATPGAGSSSSVAGVGSSSSGDVPVTRPALPTETPITGTPKVSSTALPASGAGAAGASPVKDVFFQYDKATIEADQKAILDDNVRWLKVNGSAKLSIEGHCDERGTAEYNLGLGDRRAKTVRDYLVASGIAANRISTISYGKERAFIPGHDENAWRQNRRAHFAVQGR
jgi:peptidoglycan-associated lipoprotein